MKIIDLLNKIANGEDLPEKIRYDEKIWKLNTINDTYDNGECCLFEDYIDKNYVITDVLNDEIEIIEEDKIIVEDKEGNKKEYFIKLNGGLKEGEKIFKQDNEWYVQKLVSPESEFYKWIEQFKPEIYYTLEDKTIELDKKIPTLKSLNLTEIDINKAGQVYGVTKKEMIADIQTLQNWINKIIDKMNKE